MHAVYTLLGHFFMHLWGSLPITDTSKYLFFFPLVIMDLSDTDDRRFEYSYFTGSSDAFAEEFPEVAPLPAHASELDGIVRAAFIERLGVSVDSVVTFHADLSADLMGTSSSNASIIILATSVLEGTTPFYNDVFKQLNPDATPDDLCRSVLAHEYGHQLFKNYLPPNGRHHWLAEAHRKRLLPKDTTHELHMPLSEAFALWCEHAVCDLDGLQRTALLESTYHSNHLVCFYYDHLCVAERRSTPKKVYASLPLFARKTEREALTFLPSQI